MRYPFAKDWDGSWFAVDTTADCRARFVGLLHLARAELLIDVDQLLVDVLDLDDPRYTDVRWTLGGVEQLLEQVAELLEMESAAA
jgi:hypothetical protein